MFAADIPLEQLNNGPLSDEQNTNIIKMVTDAENEAIEVLAANVNPLVMDRSKFIVIYKNLVKDIYEYLEN
jgi:hypothetical protein